MLYILDIYVSIQAFKMEQDRKKVEKNVEKVNEISCILHSARIIFWVTSKIFPSTCRKILVEKTLS